MAQSKDKEYIYSEKTACDICGHELRCFKILKIALNNFGNGSKFLCFDSVQDFNKFFNQFLSLDTRKAGDEAVLYTRAGPKTVYHRRKLCHRKVVLLKNPSQAELGIFGTGDTFPAPIKQ